MSEEYLFAGLKVIDAGSWIAAPVATTMLADFGADVIKIELPQVGDGYRAFSPSAGAPDSEVNFCWQMDARNKRSITLNLKHTDGQEILRRMVREADVFVTNHLPSFREQVGITYEDLQALNPRLIYASLTAYGEQGPERDREGFDLVAYWSRSGLMDLVRAPGAHPAAALPGMGDHPTAVSMYAGIVTAMLRRAQTGEGSYVHTSLLANGIWSASCIAQAAFADAQYDGYRQRMGHLFTRVMYEAGDGRWLQFTMVRGEEEFDLLFTILGLPEVLADPRFADQAKRLENGDVLVELIRPLIAQRPSTQWLTEFAAAGLSVALVAQVEQLGDDVQVTTNQMLREGGDTGMSKVIKHPVNIDGMPVAPVARAPQIGEHTAQVLAEFGFTAAELDKLGTEGVI